MWDHGGSHRNPALPSSPEILYYPRRVALPLSKRHFFMSSLPRPLPFPAPCGNCFTEALHPGSPGPFPFGSKQPGASHCEATEEKPLSPCSPATATPLTSSPSRLNSPRVLCVCFHLFRSHPSASFPPRNPTEIFLVLPNPAPWGQSIPFPTLP